MSTHTGHTEVGPLIDTVSVVRGAWEVRFVRVRAEVDRALHVLRVGGWAVTGDIAVGEGAWAQTAELATGVLGLDTREGVASGVLLVDDATPLEGTTAIPWIETAAVPDVWQVFGIHLGAPSGGGTAPRFSAETSITWPDGHVTLLPSDALPS